MITIRVIRTGFKTIMPAYQQTRPLKRGGLMKELFFSTVWLSLTLIVIACTVSILIGCVRSIKFKCRRRRHVEKEEG